MENHPPGDGKGGGEGVDSKVVREIDWKIYLCYHDTNQFSFIVKLTSTSE
jgi:hypothetical protein